MNLRSKPSTGTGPPARRTRLGQRLAARLFRTAGLLSLLSIGLCSCTSSRYTAGLDPFLDTQEPIRVAEATPSSESPAATAGRASTRDYRSPIAQVAHRQPAVQQVKAQVTPADPRVPIDTVAYQQPIFNGGTIQRDTPSILYADEYLFDGGDRAQPIHYDDFNRLGLDTEDTVAEYVDHLGNREVKPSNRVAIYAPRFGAVRSISQPAQGQSAEFLATTYDNTRSAAMRTRLLAALNSKGSGSSTVRMRSRASGMEADALQAVVSNRIGMSGHTKVSRLFQNRGLILTGTLDQADEAMLAIRIQAANVWTRKENPVIMAKLDSGHEVISKFRLHQLVGVEDERKSKGRLQIQKEASAKTAMPGDEITFTIRFKNLGDRELQHIRIIDNLTSRLQYVEDSETSDRPGKLTIEDNEEGSDILKFELAEPLQGHAEGVITFKARVR